MPVKNSEASRSQRLKGSQLVFDYVRCIGVETSRCCPANVRHQHYCSKPACRKESKAQSYRCWLEKPENQNYFRDPENSRRVKEWRKRNPGYWRKDKTPAEVPLQEVCQKQVPTN
jgi:hypothetical protein